MSTPTDPAPAPPEKPLPGDCCGGGCAVCVNDAYEEALEHYALQLAQWRARQQAPPDREP